MERKTMIIHEAQNGQRVAFSTAESSETKDGHIYFYDQNGVEVGRQPLPFVEPEVVEVEAPPPPQEPPVEPPLVLPAAEHEVGPPLVLGERKFVNIGDGSTPEEKPHDAVS
jgi:hypothetical protein